ncbi:MAG: tetratricopeptide repeat protein [Chitinispirillaceae bacterium]
MKSILILFLLFVWCITAVPKADEIYSKNKKANKLYDQGKYEEAQKLYEDALLLDPENNKVKMNNGSALYKMENYQEAEKLYQDALTEENKEVLADAHYNLGNILYKNAEQLETSGNPEASQKFQQALQNYIKTLELRPNDEDAKWNLQLAHQKIQQLKKQQSDDKENDDKNEGDKNKDNKSKKDNNQSEEKDNNQSEEEDKKQQNENKEQQENKSGQDEEKQKQQQQSAQKEKQEESDLKKEEAKRLIEMYADDADSLKKPKRKIPGRFKQPEKDW